MVKHASTFKGRKQMGVIEAYNEAIAGGLQLDYKLSKDEVEKPQNYNWVFTLKSKRLRALWKQPIPLK